MRAPGPLSYRATKTTHERNKRSQSENLPICLGPLVTGQVYVKITPLSIMFHQCYQQQPVCWAYSEYSVSRSAERRGRSISVTDCVHFIISFVSKNDFQHIFFKKFRLLGGWQSRGITLRVFCGCHCFVF